MQPAVLEDAFRAHRALADRCLVARDWLPYADSFTEDATYRRPGHDLVVGREAIRGWVSTHMSWFPATEIASLDVLWHGVDPRLDTVAYEVRATMRDPGDGSVHHASTLTTLQYAGDGLWSQGIDVNNPQAYVDMWRAWAGVAVRHGTRIPVEAGYLTVERGRDVS